MSPLSPEKVLLEALAALPPPPPPPVVAGALPEEDIFVRITVSTVN